MWKDLIGDNDLTLHANRGSFDADGLVCAGGGGSNGVAQYSYKGKILAVRVYSETPSSEARLRNLAIDRLRFFGAELPKDGGLAVFML